VASARTLLVKTSERKLSPQLSDAQARALVEHIHANLDCDLTLFDLSKIVHFSPRQLVRLFSNTFGKTPRQYIINERVVRAKDLLSQGRLLVEIATTLGFSSQSHFSGTFRKATGMSPGRFKRQLPARLRDGSSAQAYHAQTMPCQLSGPLGASFSGRSHYRGTKFNPMSSTLAHSMKTGTADHLTHLELSRAAMKKGDIAEHERDDRGS
jgi:AraC-like DNA-binding protein